jgi:hypothetical protein
MGQTTTYMHVLSRRSVYCPTVLLSYSPMVLQSYSLQLLNTR